MSITEQSHTIKVTILDNGLRVVTDHVAGIRSAAVGIWIGTGSRDEQADHNGAAHMVEHMLFKGTKTRTSKDLAESIENVGGYMNAYTSREITSYHAHVLKDDVGLALDVLGDMVLNSVMPDDEIERERDVILQEIGMCHDTPDDLVFDQYYETAWAGQAMGAPILGTVDTIKNMSKSDLMGFVDRLYKPDRAVISVAGAVDHQVIVDKVRAIFGDVGPSKAAARTKASYKGGEIRTEKDLEQSHVVLGFRAFARGDKDFFSSRILSAILGGGMSSRLFQEVREKRGLVYSVYSFYSAYGDNGLFGIYAGTGPERLEELMPVLCDEVQKIKQDVTEDEVSRAQTRLKAGLLMGRESMMTRADQNAKYLLEKDEAFNADDLIRDIDAVTRDKVSAVAERIFSSPHTLSGLGPLHNLEGYGDTAGRL